jgi:hydroxypyruvate reductase
VLAAAIALEGVPQKVVVAGVGTDGVDGPTPAAGAFATPESVSRARALGLDAVTMLANNDSHSFFSALGDCIITGPTGTNVNDLVIVLVYG